MNAVINYFIEANVMLLVFLAFYNLFLRNETDFRALRGFVLAAILLSLVLPLVHINPVSERNIIPSLQNSAVLSWLPAVEVHGDHSAYNANGESFDTWNLIAALYAAGVVFFFSKFIYQILLLWRLILNSKREFFNGYSVARITGWRPCRRAPTVISTSSARAELLARWRTAPRGPGPA